MHRPHHRHLVAEVHDARAGHRQHRHLVQRFAMGDLGDRARARREHSAAAAGRASEARAAAAAEGEAPMILGPELLLLLSDTTAASAGGVQGSGAGLEQVTVISVRRWFPGLSTDVQELIVHQIMEALAHERKRVH
jgi:hypothetical protein